MIKLIIFDVGGVIDTFDESMYIIYISQKLKINPTVFENALIPLLDKMEVGDLTLEEMLSRLAKKFKVSKGKLEWDESFRRINKVNDNVIKLINKLSRHYKIAILTNVSRSRHIVKMKTYLKKVKYNQVFASCYLKMAKPDPRIYKSVLNAMHVKAQEAIFVDNLVRNTSGAERIGIKSIQFIDYKKLVKDLNKLNIN